MISRKVSIIVPALHKNQGVLSESKGTNSSFNYYKVSSSIKPKGWFAGSGTTNGHDDPTERELEEALGNSTILLAKLPVYSLRLTQEVATKVIEEAKDQDEAALAMRAVLKDMEESALLLVSVARERLISSLPFFADVIGAMSLRCSWNMPTMGVTKNWTLYYNPRFVLELYAQGHVITSRQTTKNGGRDECACCLANKWNNKVHQPLSYLLGVLLHEVLHCVRGDVDNLKGRSNEENRDWNIATDATINQDIIDMVMSRTWGDSGSSGTEICLPIVSLFKGDDDREGGAGAGDDMLEGEDGEGIDECDAREYRKACARATAEAKKRGRVPGTKPGEYFQLLDALLVPSKVPWQSLLRNYISSRVDMVKGTSSSSYRRLSRRTASLGNKVILPSKVATKPKVIVVLDTSGSMGDVNQQDSPLYAAVTELSGILQNLGGDIGVINCDAEASSIKKVSSMRDFVLSGGGGTDMRVGITLAEEDRADVVVVLTDGDTPWPDSFDPRMGYIVCLTDGDRDVPGKMKKVVVEL